VGQCSLSDLMDAFTEAINATSLRPKSAAIFTIVMFSETFRGTVAPHIWLGYAGSGEDHRAVSGFASGSYDRSLCAISARLAQQSAHFCGRFLSVVSV
jgi:hypothetical protein